MNIEGLVAGAAFAVLFIGIIGSIGAGVVAVVDERWPKWGWLTLGLAVIAGGALGAVS